MLVTHRLYFGQHTHLSCDANCAKACGGATAALPMLKKTEWLADHELDDAPTSPGTAEGGHSKPLVAKERHNKWCARECERSVITRSDEWIEMPDWTKRRTLP